DRLKNRLRRAERQRESDIVPALPGGARSRAKVASYLAKALRVSALEAVDRLLFVAHRKQRANPFACVLAGEEFLGKSRNDRPLRWIGVLRLINENVVDAAVDLEQNPGCSTRAGHKVLRLEDQVFVVERGFIALSTVIFGLDAIGEQEDGG